MGLDRCPRSGIGDVIEIEIAKYYQLVHIAIFLTIFPYWYVNTYSVSGQRIMLGATLPINKELVTL